MNQADKSQQPRVTTELRAIKKSATEWEVEDLARGDDEHTLVLIVVGPKRVFAPGLLTHEAFRAWIIAMRDEGYEVTLSDLAGNPPHLDV